VHIYGRETKGGKFTLLHSLRFDVVMFFSAVLSKMMGIDKSRSVHQLFSHVSMFRTVCILISVPAYVQRRELASLLALEREHKVRSREITFRLLTVKMPDD
jgi:hypothetical protein